MGTDGRKMSKSYGNYPDPKRTITNYGGDALRLYLMGSQLLLGENINVSEDEIRDRLKSVLLPIYNCLRYFNTYASLYDFEPDLKVGSNHILDKWIILKTQDFTNKMDEYLSSYKVPPAVRLIHPFINDLSTWYIRLSRLRFVKGDKLALNTLYQVLKKFAQVVAPSIPFISEEIWQNLKNERDKESVHLTDFPQSKSLSVADQKLLSSMELMRELVSLGHKARKEKEIPVRQPLNSAICSSPSVKPSSDFVNLVLEELNIKSLKWQLKKGTSLKIALDTKITPKLKAEGKARGLVRKIGAQRKKMDLSLQDRVIVYAPDWPAEFKDYICEKALLKDLKKAKEFSIKKL